MTILNRSSDKPLRVHARYVSVNGRQHRTGYHQPRFCNCNYNDMVPYSYPANTVILNPPFLYHQLTRIPSSTYHQKSEITFYFKPPPLPCPPPHLTFTNCILPAALSVRGAGRQCMHLIALRAMELDAVGYMMLAMQADGKIRFGGLELEDDMWCLQFPPGSNSPTVRRHSTLAETTATLILCIA